MTSSRKTWKYVSRSLVLTKLWQCRSVANTPIPQKKFCGIVVLRMFLAGHRVVIFKSILAACMKRQQCPNDHECSRPANAVSKWPMSAFEGKADMTLDGLHVCF